MSRRVSLDVEKSDAVVAYAAIYTYSTLVQNAIGDDVIYEKLCDILNSLIAATGVSPGSKAYYKILSDSGVTM
jgi:hypothetical protein